VKVNWGLGFSAEGIFDGAQNATTDPNRLIGCPNFVDFVCPALVTAGSTGYFWPYDVTRLRHASVSSYLPTIKIPVLLDQGEVDTLFNLNEAIATYKALRAQHTPVDMLWRDQGHSGGTPSAAGLAYENQRIQNWFDHYLKGLLTVPTGSAFAYYRDWTGTFAEAGNFPVGSTKTYYLSSANSLTSNVLAIKSSTQAMVTTAAGAPSSLDGLDALGGVVPVPDLPDYNAPGTFVYWATPALTSALNVVGSPVLNVKVYAPTAGTAASVPSDQLVLFAKVYDVAPDGTASLINGLVAPVRVPNPAAPFTVTLPAIAHQFAAGHKVEIMLAGGDVNYRGGLVATPVTVTTGSSGQSFVLPTVAG
jgi:ABC-2 type transport system ATP-binding protein